MTLRMRCVGLILLWAVATASAQQHPCDSTARGPSHDLYCMELVPAPGVVGASGRVELAHPSGPFTVSAGPDGRTRFQLILFAGGLPSPSAMGSATTYIAWVATPMMDSVVSQGPVSNGRTRLGVVDLEKFTFLVTAERSLRPRRPSSRVVLRGQSPATRLFPPDLLQLTIGSMAGTQPGHDHSPGDPVEQHADSI